MYSFGSLSLKRLDTCDDRIKKVLREVIKIFDFTILEGFRNEVDQNLAYARGHSKVRWPEGKHNKSPSLAVDIAPFPIDWSSKEAATQRFIYLAGHVMSEARRQGIPLRWGGDWDGNNDTRDERFRDLGHFEINKE